MFRKLITELYYRYYLKGFKIYEKLKRTQSSNIEDINQRQIEALNKLLNYSYNNIPYYHEVFKNARLVTNGQINITSFQDMARIPVLTKDIIRSAGDKLYNPINYKSKKAYFNTSGGSTGEPLKVLQDGNYAQHNFANSLLINSWRKPNIFDSKIVLWGAVRDTYGSREKRKHK